MYYSIFYFSVLIYNNKNIYISGFIIMYGAGEVCCYSLLYVLLCLIFIFPPDTFVGMGLTVESLLSSWLGSEMSAFVQYHQKRTAATLIFHSLLVPGIV